MTSFSDRLRNARAESGLSRQQIADKLGITYQSVSEWETKGNRPRQDRLQKLAQVLGVSEAWLATGEGTGQIQPVMAYAPEADVPNGYSAIPEFRLALHAHTGPGCEPDWEEITESKPVFYPDEFFQAHNTTPEKCKRARVSGDSMEPFIYDGDKVTWICEPCPEIGCVHIVDGAIYVISVDGNLKIKRLQTCKDGIVVISDNERYPAETYTNEECNRIRVYGRVIDLQRHL